MPSRHHLLRCQCYRNLCQLLKRSQMGQTCCELPKEMSALYILYTMQAIPVPAACSAEGC